MDDAPRTGEGGISRRSSLLKAGGFLAAALTAGACRSNSGQDASGSTTGSGPAGVSSGAVTCVLSPEQTEGPYYISGEKVRRNVTEGKPGTPLALHLAVVDASTCRVIRGAAVDIWHCDAEGVYSGYANGGGGGGGGHATPTDQLTFLRGIQRTDSSGVARFSTIYPGWYPGRAVHIHLKVHIGGNVVHTGQLFFSDALTDAVYKRAPYDARPARTTRNAEDSIYSNGGRRGLLTMRRHGSGYVGAITMGVHRA